VSRSAALGDDVLADAAEHLPGLLGLGEHVEVTALLDHYRNAAELDSRTRSAAGFHVVWLGHASAPVGMRVPTSAAWAVVPHDHVIN
jgi:hypothetical protein